jgi:hypothetical protein
MYRGLHPPRPLVVWYKYIHNRNASCNIVQMKQCFRLIRYNRIAKKTYPISMHEGRQELSSNGGLCRSITIHLVHDIATSGVWLWWRELCMVEMSPLRGPYISCMQGSSIIAVAVPCRPCIACGHSSDRRSDPVIIDKSFSISQRFFQ